MKTRTETVPSEEYAFRKNRGTRERGVIVHDLLRIVRVSLRLAKQKKLYRINTPIGGRRKYEKRT